jgi:hypothetical protein
MEIPEHELLTFQRIKTELEYIYMDDGMTVKFTGPLAEALGQLGCAHMRLLPVTHSSSKCKLSIGGKPAGTLKNPDINLILQESIVSSFGKGETTVLDPAYRNGKEIPAQNISIPNDYKFCGSSEDEISVTMFIGKTVRLKFYKLAVYEEGGHFDWHRDTTHNDQHHATFLLALNTGTSSSDATVVDMHPKAGQDGKGIYLRAVAFYTDTEHKVEPVTKGIRIVLQYDVEVVGWGPNESDDSEGYKYEIFSNMESLSQKREPFQESFDSPTADNAAITKVTDIIESLLADEEEEVAFAMQYLYRKSFILPEFLKGTDAQLYNALIRNLDVALRPVALQLSTGLDGESQPCVATP